MNPILTVAKQLLHKGEVIVSTLKCSLTGYIITHNVPYPGMLLKEDFSFLANIKTHQYVVSI
ncbi:PlcR-regulated protein PRP2 [Bacillus mycoides]|nr:PlcR-regulated protein PRP2 [Bacillus mycoides]